MATANFLSFGDPYKLTFVSMLLACRNMLRNSMGACAMARKGRGTGGGGVGIVGGSATGGYFSVVGADAATPAAAVSYTSPPQPHFTTATASPQFYLTTPTAAYFDMATPKQPREEQQLNISAATVVEVPTAHSNRSMVAINPTKNSVQVGLV